MTIINKDAHHQYVIHDEAGTRYAAAANQSWDAIQEIAHDLGLKVPNDDRAENIVAAIFAMLWDYNNTTTASRKKHSA